MYSYNRVDFPQYNVPPNLSGYCLSGLLCVEKKKKRKSSCAMTLQRKA